MSTAEFLALPDGSALAYQHSPGQAPGILFCPGFNSDMQGAKALALEQWCQALGRQFTRFDYHGHGQSSGKLEQGCIGRWRDDTLAVLDAVTVGPQLVVGSSMGGWIALLVAMARPGRVVGLVGIAAAPDFTERLRKDKLDAGQHRQLANTGFCDIPNCYDDGEPYRISRHLLEEAESHLLLGGAIPVDVPVRLIQGQCDGDVPWQTALALAESLRSTDVEVQLVKSGDHRLSEPEDIRRLEVTVGQLLSRSKLR